MKVQLIDQTRKVSTQHADDRLNVNVTNGPTLGTTSPPSSTLTPLVAAAPVTPLAASRPQHPRKRCPRTGKGRHRKLAYPILRPHGFRPPSTKSSAKRSISLPIDIRVTFLEKMCSKLLLEVTRLQPLRGDLNRLAGRFDCLASTDDVSRQNIVSCTSKTQTSSERGSVLKQPSMKICLRTRVVLETTSPAVMCFIRLDSRPDARQLKNQPW